MEFSDLFDSFDLIVEKILSYVENSNCSLSLTCKAFYRAVSRNKNCRLRIDQNKLHHDFDSIIKIGRRFNEIFLHSSKPRDLYDINLEQSFEQMQEISSVFGRSITKARIHCTVFSSVHFTSFINNMPRLNELHLHEVRVYDHPDDDGEITWPSEWPVRGLNLKNLTILKVSECGEDFLNAIQGCLLKKVSLQKSISGRSSFFERQTHIKELNIDSLPDASNKLRNLQLQVLSVFSDKINIVNKLTDQDKDELLRLITSQSSLTKLNIYGCIDRPILTAISTQLKHLKSLSFGLYNHFEDVFPHLVSNLQRLTNLEELCVRAFNIEINSFTAVQQPQIKKLFLDINKNTKKELSEGDLIAIQRAFPSLIELGLSNCYYRNSYVLLNVFSRIETLNLRMYESLSMGTPFTLIADVRSYENITKFFFSFHDPNYDPLHTKFLDLLYRMPNLETLEMWKMSFFDKDDLISALKTNLPKLKRIILFEFKTTFVEGSTVSQHMFKQGLTLHEHF